jgi:hypothetical protein
MWQTHNVHIQLFLCSPFRRVPQNGTEGEMGRETGIGHADTRIGVVDFAKKMEKNKFQ